MPDKYLKDYQYYADLYDKYTVDECRRAENHTSTKPLKSPDDGALSEEEMKKFGKVVNEMHLYFIKGERYLNKDKTISEWMDANKKRDDLYEFSEAPVNIRCLTCRNKLSPTFKELWSEYKKPDRVLFMYDCINKCLPRRAFFSDGEEWRVKSDLCPSCNSVLTQDITNNEVKLITKYSCSKCGYTKTDEIIWTHKKEDPFDENFAVDRDRFCLTKEEGVEYSSGKSNMERLGKLTEEWKKENEEREKKLLENPNGFHLDGVGYSCFICGNNTPEGDNWFDQYGIKCLVCQKAIDEGEIPATLAKDKDSWYSKYDLESRFSIKSPTWRKWIRDGIIKPRTISYYGKEIHYQLFLIEDNKDFLPPKKLTESQSVSVIKDGKKWFSSEPWYKFVDPKDHLKGYKIIDYFKVIKEEEEPHK